MALTLDGASEEEGGVHPNRKVGVFGLSKESMRDMFRVDFFLQMATDCHERRRVGEWMKSQGAEKASEVQDISNPICWLKSSHQNCNRDSNSLTLLKK